MNAEEILSAVRALPDSYLTTFAQWLESYFAAEEWDPRIEGDIRAGRLDEIGREADASFNAGLCKPLV